MKRDAVKCLALLKSVAARHESEDGEDDGVHSWRTCRSCLAAEEFGTREGRRLLRVLLKEIEPLIAAQSPSPLSARWQELFWALPPGPMRSKLRSLEIDVSRALRPVASGPRSDGVDR